MNWVYGVTTVPERQAELFPRTLASLSQAGFDKPRLFIDNCKDTTEYEKYGLEITSRWPRIRTYGNWMLSMAELYIRNPLADRYALFQDDFVTVKGLRTYLENCPYPPNSYLNLYTFPANQKLVPSNKLGWYPSNQAGYGAVALVFDQKAVKLLLANQTLVDRPQDLKKGYRGVDGALVNALKKLGWKEYVHNPSLVQHTGLTSSMGNRRHPLAESFRGEDFDATALLNNPDFNLIPQEDWELEFNSLHKAMAEDIERLRNARTPLEVGKYHRAIADYRRRINAHLRKRK